VKRPSLRSFVEGGVVVLIGSSILLLLPTQIKEMPGLQSEMSPRLIPALLGTALIVLGFGLILQSSLGKSQSRKIEWDRFSSLRVVITIVLLIAYISIFPLLGFVVTSVVFAGFFTFFFGSRSWIKITLAAVLTPIGVWLFFEKLFRIPLPHGLMF